MVIQRLIILSMFLCLFSSARRARPAVLLTEKQMVAILTDLTLADAMVRNYTEDEATIQYLSQKNALLIYEMHDTDAVTFQENYQYYLTHPKRLQHMYTLVIKQIEVLPERY